MRKLTIGSLKYGGSMSMELNDQPIYRERPTVKETKRILKIEQNQLDFLVDVKKGQSILDAALEQDIPLEYSCKKGTCGKCQVMLVTGSAYLQPVNSLEMNKLNNKIKSGYRLACQAIVR